MISHSIKYQSYNDFPNLTFRYIFCPKIKNNDTKRYRVDTTPATTSRKNMIIYPIFMLFFSLHVHLPAATNFRIPPSALPLLSTAGFLPSFTHTKTDPCITVYGHLSKLNSFRFHCVYGCKGIMLFLHPAYGCIVR